MSFMDTSDVAAAVRNMNDYTRRYRSCCPSWPRNGTCI